MALDSKGGSALPAALFDAGSYTPLFAGEGAAVCAAYGLVGGQGAYAVCQNGEAQSAADVDIACKTLELAAKTGYPVVTFYNSKGAMLEEGLGGIAAAARLAAAASKISGVVPQIAVVTGLCGASSALAAMGADLCIMTQNSELYLTPPFLSKQAGDEVAGAGSAEFAMKAGVAAMVCDDEELAARSAAKLLMMLPPNNLSAGPSFEYVPPTQPVDIAHYSGNGAIAALADEGSALELYEGFGGGVVTSLATVAGEVTGFVATNGPGTVLGSHCIAKTARFVRLCDAFNIPLVTVVNTDGFYKSSSDELAGALRDAARLTATYADATTVKVAVVTGSAVGGVYTALGSADLTIMMEGGVVAPLAPNTAVSILYKKEIDEAEGSVDAETKAREAAYIQEVAGAAAVQKAGLADFVADSRSLRASLANALDILATKRVQRLPKKHGNMPL